MTAFRVSNEEMDNIMKIVKFFEKSVFFVKDVSQTIRNEAKEQNGGLLPMLLGKLAASLLSTLLLSASSYQSWRRTGFFMSHHPLSNIISKYVLNLDKYKYIGARWIILYVNDDNVKYFGSYGAGNIP